MFRSLYCQSVLTTERYNSTMAYYDQHKAYAGSAIAQDAGRLYLFNRWKPGGEENGRQETKWLLLPGSNFLEEKQE